MKEADPADAVERSSVVNNDVIMEVICGLRDHSDDKGINLTGFLCVLTLNRSLRWYSVLNDAGK